MTATSLTEPAVEQRPPVSSAVRKNVTALFGDLVGATAFGERVDPEAARQHGVELGMRVGINTGELVTGAGDADLFGDVLNTAARLEAACQPGRGAMAAVRREAARRGWVDA